MMIGGSGRHPPLDHSHRSHSILSASSSKRWLHCPPSAVLNDQFPDKTSVFAAEGTAMHERCEWKLRTALGEPMDEPHSEYDTEETGKIKPRLMPDGSVIFEARTLISEVNEILDSNIPDTDAADTIGGYICAELGRIPEEGEHFHFEGCGLTALILKADKRKILKLKIKGEEVHEG